MGNPVIHFEIGCRDKTKVGKFYADLFGWGLTEFGPATMIDTRGEGGIAGHLNALGHEPHNYITIYAQVDDLAACLKKAESLGGKTMIPPTEVPGAGHFAWFKDPEGTVFGIWKPAQQ